MLLFLNIEWDLISEGFFIKNFLFESGNYMMRILS